MTGATADGERYIVNGAPNQIGKTVPLARLLTLPQALQKDTQTSMTSRNTWVSLSDNITPTNPVMGTPIP